jgi:hypothetical protein
MVAAVPRKLNLAWPVRVPHVGNAEFGQLSSPGFSGAAIDIHDHARWARMEAALGSRIDRNTRERIERLIVFVRLDYQNRSVPAADVIKSIKTMHRDRTATADSPALRLACIHLETNKRSRRYKNITKYAKARLPRPKHGRHPEDLPLRRLIPSLVTVFEDVTGRQLSKSGFNTAVEPRTINGKDYPAGAEYGPFLDFVREALQFVPEARRPGGRLPPDWRLARLIRNRPRKPTQ